MSESLLTFQDAVTLVCERLRRDARTEDQIQLRAEGRTGAQKLLLEARRAGIISITIDNAFRSAKSRRDMATIAAESGAVQALTDPEAKAAATEQLLMKRGWINKQALDEYLDRILPPASEPAPEPAIASAPIQLRQLRTADDEDVKEAMRELKQSFGDAPLPNKKDLESPLRPFLTKRGVRLDRKQIRQIRGLPEFTGRPVGRPTSPK